MKEKIFTKDGLSKDILECMEKLEKYKKSNSPLYGTEIGNLYMAVKGEVLACNLSKDKAFEILDEYGVEY